MILIQNIYHMLAYAFQVLQRDHYRFQAEEDFEHLDALYAAILARAMADLLRRGLARNYITLQEDLAAPHGRIDVPDTLKRQLLRRQRISCQYDAYSENILWNQVLKATAMRLMRSPDVKAKTKEELKRVLGYLGTIDTIKLEDVRWDRLNLPKQYGLYSMLLAVCRMAVQGKLPSTDANGKRRAAYADTQAMSALYERFVRAYIAQRFPELHVSAAYIGWALEEDSDTSYLPAMRTDITVEGAKGKLIIDTKFYAHAMQYHYDKATQHSGNLYQMLAYVDNAQAVTDLPVSGALLYARTDEAIAPDQRYIIRGKRIYVKTLNLNCEFKSIEAQICKLIADSGILPFDKPAGGECSAGERSRK